jgi:hypothetical protein
MHSHFTMTLPSFHFITFAYPSHPDRSSLHFSAYFDDPPPPQLHFILSLFLTLFLKLLGLQERVSILAQSNKAHEYIINSSSSNNILKFRGKYSYMYHWS